MHANDLFTSITDQLVADIETGATGTWRMPWHTLADAGTPVNVDGRPYRGMNSLWLPLVAATAADGEGWPSGVWGTYRAWQRHGCQVRRGRTATHVVLWKPTTATVDTGDSNGDDHSKSRRRLLARVYSVFAAEQVDGADEIIADRNQQRAGRDTPERITAAEVYFHAVGATVIEEGNRAYYKQSTDTIHLPALAQFDTASHFYGCWAHEAGHWTGHADRLDRDLTGRFGSDSYAAEELVAELAAAMWCAQAGLSAVTRADHANYLAGWIRVLRTDARALVTLASRAQAAVDYLNTRAGNTATGCTITEQDDAA